MNARLRYLRASQEACTDARPATQVAAVTRRDSFVDAAHDLSTICALLEPGEDREASFVGVGRGRSDIKTGSTAI
jgi:hypothetical protein